MKRILPIKISKVSRLSLHNENFRYDFSKRLKYYREKTMDIQNFAKTLGKNVWQVKRYESGQQHPSLETFSKICIILQIDPMVFLGMQSTKFVVAGNKKLIYSWNLKCVNSSGTFGLYWVCPICNELNVEYFQKFPNKVEKFSGIKFYCYFCGNLSNKLYQLTDERLNSAKSDYAKVFLSNQRRKS